MNGKRPVYARALRLRYLHPGGLLCFLFFEGSIALGVLLALAEFAPWWGIIVLPLTVALMVKLNDVVAASNAGLRLAPAHVRQRSPRPTSGPPLRASVPHARAADTPPPSSRVGSGGGPGHPVGEAARPGEAGIRRITAEHDTRGDHRRGPNQGRFE